MARRKGARRLPGAPEVEPQEADAFDADAKGPGAKKARKPDWVGKSFVVSVDCSLDRYYRAGDTVIWEEQWGEPPWYTTPEGAVTERPSQQVRREAALQRPEPIALSEERLLRHPKDPL